ncbi:MAG: hypothetical protein IPN76_30190 [Saprospiraceae bacterium]|nr:hypothetical protein [Saprospiraceae bacterium]
MGILYFPALLDDIPNADGCAQFEANGVFEALHAQVGYSDHSLVATTHLWASKIALALGETASKGILPCWKKMRQDGPVSIKPRQLKELNEFSKLSRFEHDGNHQKNTQIGKCRIGQATSGTPSQQRNNLGILPGQVCQLGGWGSCLQLGRGEFLSLNLLSLIPRNPKMVRYLSHLLC